MSRRIPPPGGMAQAPQQHGGGHHRGHHHGRGHHHPHQHAHQQHQQQAQQPQQPAQRGAAPGMGLFQARQGPNGETQLVPYEQPAMGQATVIGKAFGWLVVAGLTYGAWKVGKYIYEDVKGTSRRSRSSERSSSYEAGERRSPRRSRRSRSRALAEFKRFLDAQEEGAEYDED